MTVDTATAVAALLAAKDVPGLEQAITDASFLDAIPGEDRQKLRAARFRLKKLRAETAAKAAAAASSTSSSERSKHAKESYDAAEFGALSAKYESLSWRIVSKPGGATVKPDEFYELYGLAMQASQGDNTSERPMWAEKGGLDFEGRARWDAWTAVKGMPADEAKLKFVKTYWEFPAKALYSDGRA